MLIKTLIKHLKSDSDLGYKLRVMPTILEHSYEYNLGRKSKKVECRFCHRHPTDLLDAQNIDIRGICFGCDEKATEYAMDARAEFYSSLEEMGIEPDDYDAIDAVMEDYSC